MQALEPAVRTEILEALPALARAMRQSALLGALIGMGYPPQQVYSISEQFKVMGLIPPIGPETQILMAQWGPTLAGTPTAPLTGTPIEALPAGMPGAAQMPTQMPAQWPAGWGAPAPTVAPHVPPTAAPSPAAAPVSSMPHYTPGYDPSHNPSHDPNHNPGHEQ